ncbi:MAG: hypothetical protein JWL95_1069 [Gemmatimonadetes bacterium]|nr:hypothetical protein [Gemmatimonadota bacterium]
MSPLELLSGSHTLHLFGLTIALGPKGLAAVAGWLLFAGGALNALRQSASGRRFHTLPPLAGAGLTLAAITAGLGLLLMESYPTFARVFCFPYALLAIAVAILGRALQAGGRPIGEE